MEFSLSVPALPSAVVVVVVPSAAVADRSALSLAVVDPLALAVLLLAVLPLVVLLSAAHPSDPHQAILLYWSALVWRSRCRSACSPAPACSQQQEL